MNSWRPKLVAMVPSFGRQLSDDPTLAEKTIAATAKELEIAK
jgi:hypothetical protein